MEEKLKLLMFYFILVPSSVGFCARCLKCKNGAAYSNNIRQAVISAGESSVLVVTF